MKKSTTASVILLALGAFAIYKYNKMTYEQKEDLKAKGKKIFDEHISPLISSTLGLSEHITNAVEQEATVRQN